MAFWSAAGLISGAVASLVAIVVGLITVHGWWVGRRSRSGSVSDVGLKQQAASAVVGAPAVLTDQFFVGRRRDLAQIHEAYAVGKSAVVVAGGLGMGKSRLAAEFVHRSRSSGYWISAEATVVRTLARLAAQYLVANAGARTEEDLGGVAIKRLAASGRGTLLVVDSAPSLEFINELINRCGSARLLVTTRDSRRGVLNPAVATIVEIQQLDLDSAAAILCSADRGKLDPRSRPIRELVAAVGCMPLALNALTARLAEDFQTPQKVLAAVRAAPNRVQFDAFKDALAATISRSDGVFTALVAALDGLPGDVRSAIAGLGYVADAPVPLGLAKCLCRADDIGLERVLREARRQSILTVADNAVLVHSLTAAAIAATNSLDDFKSVLGNARQRLSAANVAEPLVIRNEVSHYERLYDHSRRLLGDESKCSIEFGAELARGFRTLGRSADSEGVLNQMLPTMARVLGPEHQDTLQGRSNLAVGYADQGRVEEAMTLWEELLTVRQRVLGPEHPDTLANRCGLAGSYAAMGRWAQAVSLWRSTLEVMARVLGPEHPETLACRNGLAAGVAGMGRWSEATTLWEEVLSVRERALGAEHPDTLKSRGNVAAGYAHVGRAAEAAAMDERTLRERERTLGPEHPDTLKTRGNLATNYHRLGRTSDALAMNKETLRAMERVLGAEHPDTLNMRNNIASLHADLGHSAEAMKRWEELLPAMERVLGPEHPDTLKCRAGRGGECLLLGRTADGLEIIEAVLPVMERVLGLEHPDTLRCRMNLASGHAGLDRTMEAAGISETVLPVMERVLGPEHPDTLRCRMNLASSYFGLSRTTEAVRIAETALPIMERVLGPEHPDTLRYRVNLASGYADLGRTIEARAIFENVLPVMERVFGTEHPDSVWGRARFAEAQTNVEKPRRRRHPKH